MTIDKDKILALNQDLKDAEKVVITAHMAPDGDALGSSLALYHVLTKIGKNVHVVVPDEFSKQLSILPGAKEIVVYTHHKQLAESIIGEADLLFCLDYNDILRIDRIGQFVSGSKARKVMIDHHLEPSDLCDIIISYPLLSSTCMLLYLVLCELGLKESITKEAATCILAGMMTDTGNFSYNANDPDIYPIIGELISLGVNHDELARQLFDTFNESYLKIQGYALSRKMKVWKEYGAALITLTRDELNRMHYCKGDTEGLVNKPLAIPGVVYSIFLREEERYIKVSMRSLGDFPCDKICSKYFGGGGHLNAAGGEFYGSMAQAEEVFKSILPTNKKLYINKKNTDKK